ncbi:hypothetical protein OS493_018464 [Desmophyllum pertusum]|uniref:Uncharacterized protein n=1 Tax=Desmophyllum pertusum TaxID=174260 RepID=A0A9X0A4F6_9CNID|nr:hypothetical protein OS493_018464 [Desmophyllum pertusum]
MASETPKSRPSTPTNMASETPKSRPSTYIDPETPKCRPSTPTNMASETPKSRPSTPANMASETPKSRPSTYIDSKTPKCKPSTSTNMDSQTLRPDPDVLFIRKTVNTNVNKTGSLGCLTEQEFALIEDARGWLDCSIIHQAQCPGNKYYHLKCINLKNGPEESPCVTELNNAEREILKHVQHRCFKQERERLKQADRQTSASRQNALKNSSSIFKLDPTLTQDELEVVYDRRQLITTQSTQSFCPRDTM